MLMIRASPFKTQNDSLPGKVLPLLKNRCFACHGESPDGDLKGDLDLTSRKAMLKGGESGDPSLIPENPDESLIYQAIRWDGYEMPPKENDRLSKPKLPTLKVGFRQELPGPRQNVWMHCRKKAGRPKRVLSLKHREESRRIGRIENTPRKISGPINLFLIPKSRKTLSPVRVIQRLTHLSITRLPRQESLPLAKPINRL